MVTACSIGRDHEVQSAIESAARQYAGKFLANLWQLGMRRMRRCLRARLGTVACGIEQRRGSGYHAGN